MIDCFRVILTSVWTSWTDVLFYAEFLGTQPCTWPMWGQANEDFASKSDMRLFFCMCCSSLMGPMDWTFMKAVIFPVLQPLSSFSWPVLRLHNYSFCHSLPATHIIPSLLYYHPTPTCSTHSHMLHPLPHAPPIPTCCTHPDMLHTPPHAPPTLTCCTHPHMLHQALPNYASIILRIIGML